MSRYSEAKGCIILWDIENCCVPTGMSGGEAVRRIKDGVLRPTSLELRDIVAIGNVERIDRTRRAELQASGLSMHDCASGKKSAADIAIIMEIWKFTHYTPPPYTICLISGDGDFGKVVNFLDSRGYSVILVHPRNVSRVFTWAGSEKIRFLDWNALMGSSCQRQLDIDSIWVGEEDRRTAERSKGDTPGKKVARSLSVGGTRNGLRRKSIVEHTLLYQNATPLVRLSPSNGKAGVELPSEGVDASAGTPGAKKGTPGGGQKQPAVDGGNTTKPTVLAGDGLTSGESSPSDDSSLSISRADCDANVVGKGIDKHRGPVKQGQNQAKENSSPSSWVDNLKSMSRLTSELNDQTKENSTPEPLPTLSSAQRLPSMNFNESTFLPVTPQPKSPTSHPSPTLPTSPASTRQNPQSPPSSALSKGSPSVSTWIFTNSARPDDGSKSGSPYRPANPGSISAIVKKAVKLHNDAAVAEEENRRSAGDSPDSIPPQKEILAEHSPHNSLDQTEPCIPPPFVFGAAGGNTDFWGFFRSTTHRQKATLSK